MSTNAAETLALSALGRVLGSQDLGGAYGAARDELRAVIAQDPLDAVIATSLGSAWLFYVAERDANPEVNSFWDALVFTTTCLSVGYARVFAVTTAGKAIASALMTLGPAMAARALEPPSAAQRAREDTAQALAQQQIDTQRALVDRLDALVARVDAMAVSNPATSPG
ncbi:MAG: ion channel [Deltaproteobacteria bacterium]|nr:ion channel [Deltaproteobacteria bacterium]